jgi:hypothetical protein
VSHQELLQSPHIMLWLEAPGLLITLFAQGHVLVTAWHLSRLGISSFDNRRIGPKTWLEMFWLSGKQWQNPLWLKTFYSAKKRHGAKLQISITFIMFVFAIVVTLPAPLVLKKAYVQAPIETHYADYQYSPSISSLFPNASNALDPYTQLNIGQNAWASGFNVVDTYPFRVFAPPGTDLLSSDYNASVLSDIVFSADMDPGAYGELPGIRVQSFCAIQEIDNLNLTLKAGSNVTQGFWDLCDDQELTLRSEYQRGPAMNMSYNVGFCHNLPTKSLDMEEQGQVYWNSTGGVLRNETALIWLDLSDYNRTSSTRGIIECNMSTTDNMARLWFDVASYDIQFTDAKATQLFNYNASRPIGHYWPPLLTALNTLLLPVETITTDGVNDDVASSESFISKVKMLGFALTKTWDDDIQLYRKPSLEEATTALWNGALHMAGAINIGASTIQQNELTFRISDSWWISNPPYRLCVFVLLGVWFGIMLVLSIFLYRPAFAGSMDGYVIAQVCAEYPQLFEAKETGDAHHNPRMLEPFRVADAECHSNIEESSGK